MSTLALNAGSSGIKFGLFNENGKRLTSGEIDWASGKKEDARLTVHPHHGVSVRSRLPISDTFSAATCAIHAALNGHPLSEIAAVGHRVVFAGAEYHDSVLIDGGVKAAINCWSDFAPLHNPSALNAMEAAGQLFPNRPQVAVFDTTFYRDLPPKAFLFPVPYDWYENWGVRRFGFHGISHAGSAAGAARLLGRLDLRIISCHLGGGCSVTAIRDGVPVATTGGFSPLGGLMMSTRCGSLDPGILLHLLRQNDLSPREISRLLTCRSGLLGISGISADLAQIEVAAAQGNERARLAFEIFAEQIRSAIGALAATLGGVDALTFTDRIGEHSAALRASACDGLAFMGIQIDPERNAAARADSDIATNTSKARVLIIHCEEDRFIAEESRRVTKFRSNMTADGIGVGQRGAAIHEPGDTRQAPP